MAKIEGNLDKLPKWAKKLIADLERERDDAIRTLKDFTDIFKPRPFELETWASIDRRPGPSVFTAYVQTRQMRVNFKGVCLDILCSEDRQGIELTWSDRARSAGADHVCFQPYSTNSVRLLNLFYELENDPWMIKNFDYWSKKYGSQKTQEDDNRKDEAPGETQHPEQGGNSSTDSGGETSSEALE